VQKVAKKFFRYFFKKPLAMFQHWRYIRWCRSTRATARINPAPTGAAKNKIQFITTEYPFCVKQETRGGVL
jgi:hypothetical protein